MILLLFFCILLVSTVGYSCTDDSSYAQLRLRLIIVFDEDVDHLQGEHLAELLLGHAGSNKLISCDLSVFILIHLSKGRSCDHLLGSLVNKMSNTANKKALPFLPVQDYRY